MDDPHEVDEGEDVGLHAPRAHAVGQPAGRHRIALARVPEDASYMPEIVSDNELRALPVM